jgi:hypothetical protein
MSNSSTQVPLSPPIPHRLGITIIGSDASSVDNTSPLPMASSTIESTTDAFVGSQKRLSSLYGAYTSGLPLLNGNDGNGNTNINGSLGNVIQYDGLHSTDLERRGDEQVVKAMATLPLPSTSSSASWTMPLNATPSTAARFLTRMAATGMGSGGVTLSPLPHSSPLSGSGLARLERKFSIRPSTSPAPTAIPAPPSPIPNVIISPTDAPVTAVNAAISPTIQASPSSAAASSPLKDDDTPNHYGAYGRWGTAPQHEFASASSAHLLSQGSNAGSGSDDNNANINEIKVNNEAAPGGSPSTTATATTVLRDWNIEFQACLYRIHRLTELTTATAAADTVPLATTNNDTAMDTKRTSASPTTNETTTTASSPSSTLESDLSSAYHALAMLSREFVFVAETYGRIIISECFLPPQHRSIPPLGPLFHIRR